MKIMWLCNAPIPQVAEACKISNTIHEGWLISVAAELERRDDVQFVFVMPNREVTEGVHYTEKGNSLYIGDIILPFFDATAILSDSSAYTNKISPFPPLISQ